LSQDDVDQTSVNSLSFFKQGVYKFNWTNFEEIPGGISRKIQDILLCNVPNLLV